MKQIQYLCTLWIILIHQFPYPFCPIANKYQRTPGWEYFQYFIKKLIMAAQMSHIVGVPDIVAVFGDIFDPVTGMKYPAKFDLPSMGCLLPV